MIYNITIGKRDIEIDQDELDFIKKNQDSRFIELKTGELINTAFVQGIFIDEEASKKSNMALMSSLGKKNVPDAKIEELRGYMGSNDRRGIAKVGELLETLRKDIVPKQQNG